MNGGSETTLDRLPPGARAVVIDLAGDDVLSQRLLEMGLLPETPVQFLRAAPLGDPIEIRINDSFNLSLRKSDASQVRVSILT